MFPAGLARHREGMRHAARSVRLRGVRVVWQAHSMLLLDHRATTPTCVCDGHCHVDLVCGHIRGVPGDGATCP